MYTYLSGIIMYYLVIYRVQVWVGLEDIWTRANQVDQANILSSRKQHCLFDFLWKQEMMPQIRKNCALSCVGFLRNTISPGNLLSLRSPWLFSALVHSCTSWNIIGLAALTPGFFPIPGEIPMKTAAFPKTCLQNQFFLAEILMCVCLNIFKCVKTHHVAIETVMKNIISKNLEKNDDVEKFPL